MNQSFRVIEDDDPFLYTTTSPDNKSKAERIADDPNLLRDEKITKLLGIIDQQDAIIAVLQDQAMENNDLINGLDNLANRHNQQIDQMNKEYKNLLTNFVRFREFVRTQAVAIRQSNGDPRNLHNILQTLEIAARTKNFMKENKEKITSE